MQTGFCQRSLIFVLLVAGLWAGSIPQRAPAVTDADFAEESWEAIAPNDAREIVAEPNLFQVIGRLLIALGIVFGLMWLVVWLARRYLPQAVRGGSAGGIELLANRSIGSRRNLLLVRVHDKTLLVGVTANAIQTLTELDEESVSWREAVEGADLSVVSGSRPSAGTTALE